MKKIILSTISLAAFSVTSVFAADLPSNKSAPVATPTPIWTGFYAGLNIGYGFGTSNGSYTKDGPLLDTWDNVQARNVVVTSFWDTSQGILLGNMGGVRMTQNGVIGGGQMGYNYQWRDRYILGFEADIQGSGISGNGTSSNIGQGELDYRTRGGGVGDFYTRYVAGSNNINASVSWLGTARARIGYLITPTLMAYATGGLTYGEITASSNPTALTSYFASAGNFDFRGYQGAVGYSGNSSALAVGWNAGGGFEWMFADRWSIKTEAFYYSLGGQTVESYTYAPAYALRSSGRTGEWMTKNYTPISYNGIIARAGVNYHFNLATVAPVVAKF
jgi:outer membrane immunogenic protein